MHLRGALRWVVLMLPLAAVVGWATAGESPKKEEDTPKKADEPTKKADEPKKAAKGEELAENVVGKVDEILITRDDLKQTQRQIMALNPKAAPPNWQQLLDQLIERVLWQRYFEKKNLRPSGAQIQRALQQIDGKLREQGTTYQRWIASLNLTAEEHAGLIAFELASAQLSQSIQADIQEDEIKKEFEAHPEWFDGSRIRISQIFVETADIVHDPDKLKKAKERIDKVYTELQASKDFEEMARRYSDRVASGMRGGDEAWFTRKGVEDNEKLIAAAWALKVGEHTKPVEGTRGWHIVKVTDREVAALTPFGARRNVLQELIRRRANAILDEMKAKAKIERRI